MIQSTLPPPSAEDTPQGQGLCVARVSSLSSPQRRKESNCRVTNSCRAVSPVAKACCEVQTTLHLPEATAGLKQEALEDGVNAGQEPNLHQVRLTNASWGDESFL